MRLIILLLLLMVAPVSAQNTNDLPTTFDVVMLAGADYLLTLKNTDSNGAAINIAGYTFSAQFRSSPAPAGQLFATYSTSIVDAATGKVKMTLSKAQTLSLSGKSGVWDMLQVDPTGKAMFLLSGKASVRPTVTR